MKKDFIFLFSFWDENFPVKLKEIKRANITR